ncbi:MAG: hypothetical protein V1809_07470 [Planctomycetota bacterium]
MNKREITAWVLAACGVAAAGYFGSQSRPSPRDGASCPAVRTPASVREVETARAEAAALRLTLAEAERRAETAEAAMAASGKPAGGEVAAIADPADGAAAVVREGRGRRMVTTDGDGARSARPEESSEEAAARRARMMKARANGVYGEWLRDLGLPEDRRAAVEDALAARLAAVIDVQRMLFQRDVSVDDVLRKQDEAAAASRQAIEAVLGPAEIEKLQVWEREAPLRGYIDRMGGALWKLDLEPWQAQAVRTAVREEWITAGSPALASRGGGPLRGTGLTPLSADEIRRRKESEGGWRAAWAEEDKAETALREKVDVRLGTILTPAQAESWKRNAMTERARAPGVATFRGR